MSSGDKAQADQEDQQFGYSYSRRLATGIARFVESQSKQDPTGTATAAVAPQRTSPLEFKEQTAGTAAQEQAFRAGSDAATAKYGNAVNELQSAVAKYENIIEHTVETARNFKPELPEEDQKRLATLTSLIGRLQDTSRSSQFPFGTSCKAERNVVVTCLNNNRETPFPTCLDVVSVFSQCAEKASSASAQK